MGASKHPRANVAFYFTTQFVSFMRTIDDDEAAEIVFCKVLINIVNML